SVAYKSNPNSWKRAAMSYASCLSLSATVNNTEPSNGIDKPDAINPLYSAFSSVASYPIASPVDFISGPNVVSTLLNFSNEKTGDLTYTCSHSGKISVLNPFSFNVSPKMHRVAKFAIVSPVILLINGIVRLARGLTSMTYTSSF